MDLIDKPPFIKVINVPVTALNFDIQIDLMTKWAKARESKGVFVANVHMLVEAYQDPAFATIMQKADVVTPDGMPLVWMLRRLGNPSQNRVAGLDIMLSLCKRAMEEQISIFLLGSELEILKRMQTRFQREFPNLKIAGAEPLPFRPLTEAENEAIAETIERSGAGIVMVSLGCPKQETWIAMHLDKIRAVMIGLGGVFPVYAGLKKPTPRFIQNAGLEWLFRLAQDPQRLFPRYATTNPIFLYLAFKQLFIDKTSKKKRAQEINAPQNLVDRKAKRDSNYKD